MNNFIIFDTYFIFDNPSTVGDTGTSNFSCYSTLMVSFRAPDACCLAVYWPFRSIVIVQLFRAPYYNMTYRSLKRRVRASSRGAACEPTLFATRRGKLRRLVLLVLGTIGLLKIWVYSDSSRLSRTQCSVCLRVALAVSSSAFRSRFATETRSLKNLVRVCQENIKVQEVYLVTGAAGFVGSHVATALKKRHAEVVGLDNMNDYYPQGLKRSRTEKLHEIGVHVVEADLNDAMTVRKILATCKVTTVVHLAAQAGVRYAVKNPEAYVYSNVAGFVTLMEEIVRMKRMPKVIFASSSSVYGLNTKVPFSETDVTDSPASLYAATKKADELLAHTYNHIHGVALTALRFFTVYGPYGRPDMAYYSFTNSIMQDMPIKIFKGPDGGEIARDFTYIDDIVRGTIAACDTSEKSGRTPDGSKPPFRVYNLGNTKPVTVSDFVSSLEKALGKKANRNYVPMPKTGDVPFTHANVSAAKQDLGYNPTVSLDEGLQNFVQWYKKYYEGGAHKEDTNYIPMR